MGRKIPEVIKEAELLEIIKETKKKQKRLAYLLGFYQCLRISEIVGLFNQVSTCCNVSIDKIKEKGKQQIYKCSKCQAQLEMKQIRRKREAGYQIQPLTSTNLDGEFLRIRGGKGEKDRTIPIAVEVKKHLKYLPVGGTERALEASFKKVAQKVLGKNLHFHCLRHSGATHYLNVKKWNIRLVQQFLGHSNLNTTQIYTHVSPQDLLAAMKNEVLQ